LSGTVAIAHPGRRASALLPLAIVLGMKALYAILQAPENLFLVALAGMLFRPPDLAAFPFDRIVLGLLIAVAAACILVRRSPIHIHMASWPMLALAMFGLWSALAQPYDARIWSVLAAKWIVPLILFHIGGFVFASDRARQKLEWFSIAVLLYLSITAVFSLLNLKSLIFPRYILDEAIGIHADRARGPFLQAVANGVCLNLLGIIALHSFDLRRLRGLLAGILLILTPLALLATQTRAVWIGAATSIVALIVFGHSRRFRGVAIAITCLAGLSVGTALLLQTNLSHIRERLEDRSPVEFRVEMYRAGWAMFTEKPLLGWGSEALIQPEIEKRITSFHPDYYIFHNTYLELAVQKGILGLSLYAWLFIALFQSRKNQGQKADQNQRFLGSRFQVMWGVMVLVYLVNASAVVMNYQFVNAYFFTIAGILSTQTRSDSRSIATSGVTDEYCLSV
jgi:putative inorganic carbon (hco3(-)) transporter